MALCYLKLCSLASCRVYNLPHGYKIYSLLLKPSFNTSHIFFPNLLHKKNKRDYDNSEKNQKI